ncbi:MAG: CoA activase [Candidatus Marinimicrobia bacterium]|nr:CoA activase [Candidatus Neomarinimicrobiota bacterium]
MYIDNRVTDMSLLNKPEVMRLGIDVGSTTAKLVLMNQQNDILFSQYRRHRANISETLLAIFDDLQHQVGHVYLSPSITGSAGMGIAERHNLPFIQEVVAASQAAQYQFPNCRMLIDIGGEDSKMIFFGENTRPDMRMNGNCAGGTGAFIDQMASLLHVSPEQFGELALQGTHRHTIASRCGVFAKTDIQNLINNGISKSDIALSVFHAVAVQAVNSLARGHDIQMPVVFVGGPLFYFRALRESFREVLSISTDDSCVPEESQIYPAFGAALSIQSAPQQKYSLQEFIRIFKQKSIQDNITDHHETLFRNEAEFEAWNSEKHKYDVPQIPLKTADGKDIYLGIDAGSTTTKIVAIDDQDRILFLYYGNNHGNPINSVRTGLKKLKHKLDSKNIHVKLNRTAVTGYGEELIQSAFEVDDGMVETVAHYNAAKKLDPDVSFILDIGGQDMKAIFIKNGLIRNIEVNEACSSGCGSFIETFADSLGYSAPEFGQIACGADRPVDLGSRCTVFMNSGVKQALRQGSGAAEVSAGLAYSVIENCLNKVLKIADPDVLGENIVVQGGTFKNPAVLRAMELSLGKTITRPDIAEAMGAYGAAITARQNKEMYAPHAEVEHPLLRNIGLTDNIQQRSVTCKACSNHCRVQRMVFPNGRKFYTGNKCERIYTNNQSEIEPGDNLYAMKYDYFRKYMELNPGKSDITIGIPMILNFYENLPFWATLFNSLGIRVELSAISAADHNIKGAGTVMSDNICYPAKIAHSHVTDLISKRVDRIFYPRVVYEESQFSDSANHYNCPIITGYPDVIQSAIDPESQGIPLESPALNLNDPALLEDACWQYLEQFHVEKSQFRAAFRRARKSMVQFREDMVESGKATINKARANNDLLIILAGRPYHTDPKIHHKIPDMISKMGAHVLPMEVLPLGEMDLPESLEVGDQWEYSNRLYRAAHWAGSHENTEFVQLNSFGCGPDAVTIDEVRAILKTYGKTPVVLKIDEISSLGSAKLRIRSMIESRSNELQASTHGSRVKTPVFKKTERKRTILAPDFSPFYSVFAESVFKPLGYNVEILPPADKESSRVGLKYANNDICYPATLTIGDILKALQSGKYNPDEIAVALTETGGQCRATNYVSLLKKALINAGYTDIPVISASLNRDSLNDQPGFSMNKPKVIGLAFSGMLVVDQLVRMYHATAVREVVEDTALKVLDTHLEHTRKQMGQWSVQDSQTLLQDAIEDFNGVNTFSGEYPKAGLVGEIYVKYNPFSNGNIADKLMNEGIEVTVPPLMTFFLKKFVSQPFNHENNIEKTGYFARKGLSLLERIVDDKIRQTNKLMTQFRQPLEPIHPIGELAKKAVKVISLTNQYGEGWLLPAEVVAMAESGIQNILSLQPFGCIANHIVAKGISKKLSSLYPDLNYMTLDMDAGNSDANVQNRLAFFIHSAQQSVPEFRDARNKNAALQQQLVN